MKIFSILLTVLVLFNSAIATGNLQCNLYGKVIDKTTKEPLPYANISISNTHYGAASDKDGLFYIQGIKLGKYLLHVSYIGYKSFEKEVDLNQSSLQLLIELEPTNIAAQEIVIYGTSNEFRNDINISQINLSPKQIKLLPSLGEPDVLRSLQILPSIFPANDFSTNFHVRGGKTDENLILLDDIIIYNPYHLGGIFSTFDANAIRCVEFSKGLFLPEYGGRLSSILHATSRDGKMDKYHANIQLSLISSKVLLEGPLSHSISILLSLRRTYIDKLTREFPYHFFDGIGKMTFRINRKNEIRLNGFMDKDVLHSLKGDEDDDSSDYDWGNNTIGLTWKHFPSASTFWETSLSRSYFKFDIKIDNEQISDYWDNRIHDITFKMSRSSFLNEKFFYKTGIEIHRQDIKFLMITHFDNIENLSKIAYDLTYFVKSELSFNTKLKLEGGIRNNYFSFNDHFQIEPKIGLHYFINPNFKCKAAISYATQNLASINDESALFQLFNTWQPISKSNPPQSCLQSIAGFELSSNRMDLNLEIYHKRYFHIAVLNPFHIYENEPVLLMEKGEAYGAEILLKSSERERYYYWLSYGTGLTLRVDKDNVSYYPNYDRRHSVKAILGYNFSRTGKISLIGTFQSGNWIPKIFGQYYKHTIDYYPEVQDITLLKSTKEKLPAYKRIDVNLSWEWRKFELYFQILNIFNFKNYLYYTFENKGDLYLPILPSFGMTYKF